jgi:hypothetical protein
MSERPANGNFDGSSLALSKCKGLNSTQLTDPALNAFIDGLYCLKNSSQAVVEGRIEDSTSNFR